MIDLGIAIDFFAVNVEHKPLAAGSYDTGGNWVGTTGGPITISASIQPIKGAMLKDVPEGVRSEATKVAHTGVALENGDFITHKGKDYRVLHVWDHEIGGFTRAALGLVKND